MMADANYFNVVKNPLMARLPIPDYPPPLIERLRKEATEATQVSGSNIYYYFGQSHLLGRGASCYGVFRGYHGTPEKKAAVKLVVWNADMNTNELDIWNHIRSNPHPCSKYVISIYECALGTISIGDDSCKMLFICMELALCSLEHELTYTTNYNRDLPEYNRFIKNVAAGLEFLHHINIVHRDIKPHNVLLFESEIPGNRMAKLGDYDLCRLLSRTDGSTSLGKGTMKWMSPEALRAFEEEETFLNTKAMDIFSLGLVAYYTLHFQKHPFEQNGKLLVNIKDPNLMPNYYEMKYVAQGSSSAAHLFWWMLQKDPCRRPTIQQCRSHPYFWVNLEEKSLQFFADVLEAVMSEDDDCPDDPNVLWVLRCTDYAISEYFKDVVKASPIKRIRELGWNWKREVDQELLESISTKYQMDYNACSVYGLIRFIRDKAKQPEWMLDGVVDRLFAENGKFCRVKYARYFLDIYPYTTHLVFFTLARISPRYPHLSRLEEKYFGGFAGCHEYWTHDVVAKCLERLTNSLKEKGVKI